MDGYEQAEIQVVKLSKGICKSCLSFFIIQASVWFFEGAFADKRSEKEGLLRVVLGTVSAVL